MQNTLNWKMRIAIMLLFRSYIAVRGRECRVLRISETINDKKAQEFKIRQSNKNSLGLIAQAGGRIVLRLGVPKSIQLHNTSVSSAVRQRPPPTELLAKPLREGARIGRPESETMSHR